MLEGGAGFKVTGVEYVVSPTIVRAFQAAKADLEKTGLYDHYPIMFLFTSMMHTITFVCYSGESVLAFHGTREENIALICETGFRVPKKDKNFKQQTDTGTSCT